MTGQSGLIKNRRKRRRRRRRIAKVIVWMLFILALCCAASWLTENPIRSEATKPEQLKNREEYPKELVELLEQNEETYDFVINYPERETYQNKDIDVSEDCKGDGVPLLMQWDKRWGYDLYGDSMIGVSGCGPTCMTMAYLYLTEDNTMNPRKMAEYAQGQGYHGPEGTSWEFWTRGAQGIGLYGEELSLNESTMKAVLDSGGVIVCSMSPGDFTDGGHYILLCGYDEQGFFVNDPNRKSNSEKQWDYETLCGQMKNLWGIFRG